MSVGWTKRQIAYRFKVLRKKYPGVAFELLRASNGECAIMPIKRQKEVKDEVHNATLRGE